MTSKINQHTHLMNRSLHLDILSREPTIYVENKVQDEKLNPIIIKDAELSKHLHEACKALYFNVLSHEMVAKNYLVSTNWKSFHNPSEPPINGST